MIIRVDDLMDPRVIDLINIHLEEMSSISPQCGEYALSAEELKDPKITLWTAWENNELLGCGALKELDSRNGEVKSMRTSKAHLRKGVARTLLQHIIDESRRRGYVKINLETGPQSVMEPARKLYLGYGFQFCGPFSDYRDDPNSVFMELNL